MKVLASLAVSLVGWLVAGVAGAQTTTDIKSDLKKTIAAVNIKWQQTNTPLVRSFWDEAAYHTANMEVYKVLGDTAQLNYSLRWAEHNEWMGATEPDTLKWVYERYGEKPQYVLFGDWQTCFQVYADFYALDANPKRIARAREVMEYQMRQPKNDYWYWSDALYMVMPVMTRMYKATGNTLYLDKLYEYWSFARDLMFDAEANLYYRDAKYVYPKHKSVNGKKDFWARGCGWVIAAWARVLTDLPAEDKHRAEYEANFRALAQGFRVSQQPDGYWTRSILDPDHAPGPETSGTAFMAYGMQWGVNNGLLPGEEYQPVCDRAWKYLSEVALQADSTIGYVQPIGEKAIPGQKVDARSTANFGVGAFLLAAIERLRM